MKTILLLLILCFGLKQTILSQNMNLVYANNTTDTYVINSIKKMTFVGNNINIGLKTGTTDTKDIITISQITFNDIITSTLLNEETISEPISLFPNPSNGTMKINYTLQKESPVEIKIYNLTGVVVKQINLCLQQKGNYIYSIDASDALSNGTYFCQVLLENENLTNKIIIIK